MTTLDTKSVLMRARRVVLAARVKGRVEREAPPSPPSHHRLSDGIVAEATQAVCSTGSRRECPTPRTTPTPISTNTKRRYYHRWAALKRRCYNPKAKDFRHYGARGITMHAPWVESYAAFYHWLEANLGPCPAKHVLKRHNVDGHFEPGNVYWGSHTAQSRGRRNVVLSLDAARVMRAMRADGQQPLDIAAALGVSQDLVAQVLAGSIWKEAA